MITTSFDSRLSMEVAPFWDQVRIDLFNYWVRPSKEVGLLTRITLHTVSYGHWFGHAVCQPSERSL